MGWLIFFVLVPWLINALVPLVVFLPFSLFLAESSPGSSLVKLVNALIQAALLAGYAACYLWLRRRFGPTEKMNIGKVARMFFFFLKNQAWYFALLAAIAIIFPVLRYSAGISLGFSRSPISIPCLSIVASVVAGPIIEELLFRQSFFGYCEGRGVKSIALYSALAFTFVHGYGFNPWDGLVFLETFVVSYFVLSKPYHISRSIMVPILLHAANNASAIVCDILASSAASTLHVPLSAIMGISIVLVLLFLPMLRKTLKLSRELSRLKNEVSSSAIGKTT